MEESAVAEAARQVERNEEALGPLPVWDLSDLYSGMDAPEVKRDLERSAELSTAFETRYKGKLAELASGAEGGARLAEAIGEYERIEEIMGRLASYAGPHLCRRHVGPGAGEILRRRAGPAHHDLDPPHLLHAGAEPARRRRARNGAARRPALAHYRPWIEDLRLEKPYQLDDTIERLFHEKSVTGRGAWNRLFDETLAALRFDVEGETLTLEPTLQPPGRMRRRRGGGAAAEALAVDVQGEPPALHATSPTCSPRTSRSPTSGAAFQTSPPRGTFPIVSSRRSSMRW